MYSCQAFYHTGPTVWNSLPDELKIRTALTALNDSWNNSFQPLLVWPAHQRFFQCDALYKTTFYLLTYYDHNVADKLASQSPTHPLFGIWVARPKSATTADSRPSECFLTRTFYTTANNVKSVWTREDKCKILQRALMRCNHNRSCNTASNTDRCIGHSRRARSCSLKVCPHRQVCTGDSRTSSTNITVVGSWRLWNNISSPSCED